MTKFAYFKELVEPRVRKGIDGLPFTTEGYERAKSILKSNYGKMSEIVNAYIENTLALHDSFPELNRPKYTTSMKLCSTMFSRSKH